MDLGSSKQGFSYSPSEDQGADMSKLRNCVKHTELTSLYNKSRPAELCPTPLKL